MIAVEAAAAPGLGSHTLSYYYLSENDATILSTVPMTTQSTGSTVLVCVGRGDYNAFSAIPSDSKGNGAYDLLGSAHRYTNWNNSGTALYTCPSATGGSAHVVSVGTPAWDEITMAAVEVTAGGEIQDYKWNEVLEGSSITSQSVTTTGPATLVAFWWGDASAGPYTATPNNGFVVKDAVLLAHWIVQCAVATKSVPGAGTYNVTWTATPAQGAQLYLVAIQTAAASAVPGAGDGPESALRQNYPNPFNPSTTIAYAIPEGMTGRATLRVYDMAGREVTTLVDKIAEPGYGSVQFHAGNLASGAYFYRLMVEPSDPSGQGLVEVKQFVLLR